MKSALSDLTKFSDLGSGGVEKARYGQVRLGSRLFVWQFSSENSPHETPSGLQNHIHSSSVFFSSFILCLTCVY